MSHNDFDVIMPGYLFCDLIFQGLPSLPQLGEEIFSKGLHISPGGVYITVVAMKRLGMSVGLIADLGNDIFSDFIRLELRHEGISDTLLRNHPKPMPTITAALSFPNDRAFVTYMAELDKIGPFSEDTLNACSARHLHLPGLKEAFASKKLIIDARKRGLTISLDCQWHPDLMEDPGLWEILSNTHVFLPNEKEAIYLTKTDSPEDALNALRKKVNSAIIKLGPHGAIGFDKDNDMVRVPALNVDAIDTTGAGDSFNAGFLYAYLSKLSLKESMAYGNVCGGLSVSKMGGSTALPTLEQLQGKLEILLRT